jgi:hypothetical protein
MVGYEMMGESQRDVTESAEMLKQSDIHYQDKTIEILTG